MDHHEHQHNHPHVEGGDTDGESISTSSATEAANLFCDKTDSMIMYMDGLRFSLWTSSSTSSPPPCLNLLFSHATLDTRFKFGAAMVGVVLFAIVVEGIAKLRHVTMRLISTTSSSNASSNNSQSRLVGRSSRSSQSTMEQSSFSTHLRRVVLLRMAVPLLHGTQALLGYTLMLITMTYSMELLLCVVLGLSIGYYVFFVRPAVTTFRSVHVDGDGDDDDARFASSSPDESAQLLQHVATNPCCDFMQDEGGNGSGNINGLTSPHASSDSLSTSIRNRNTANGNRIDGRRSNGSGAVAGTAAAMTTNSTV